MTASPISPPGLKPCPMVLVFGCRQSRIDHIYKEETLFAKTQGVFRELYTAYSREPDKPKVGVAPSPAGDAGGGSWGGFSPVLRAAGGQGGCQQAGWSRSSTNRSQMKLCCWPQIFPITVGGAAMRFQPPPQEVVVLLEAAGAPKACPEDGAENP